MRLSIFPQVLEIDDYTSEEREFTVRKKLIPYCFSFRCTKDRYGDRGGKKKNTKEDICPDCGYFLKWEAI